MDLTKFKGADEAVKLTIRLSIAYCIILTFAFITCIIYLTIKIDNAYNSALVIDREGSVYKATSMPSSSMRKYEYINHVKTFVTQWYAFDESTYEMNISSALNLIGNKGKELLNEYNDVNMFNSLVQKNIRYGVAIMDIQINMNTIPVTGKVSFKQTGFRARGKISRMVEVEFTIYDVSRSEKNAHGAKIEDWIVHYSEPQEETETTNRTNKIHTTPNIEENEN